MIDWKRPYGTICGNLEEWPTAKYTQDGKYYKANGEEILPEEVEESPYDSLHWRQLKAKVEAKGGEWTNKQDAIEFLENGDLS